MSVNTHLNFFIFYFNIDTFYYKKKRFRNFFVYYKKSQGGGFKKKRLEVKKSRKTFFIHFYCSHFLFININTMIIHCK